MSVNRAISHELIRYLTPAEAALEFPILDASVEEIPFSVQLDATIAALATHPSTHPDFYDRLAEERRIRLERLDADGDRNHYE